MSPVAMLLKSVVLPAVVAALAFALCRWFLKRRETSGRDGAAVAIGIGMGYVAGHLAVAWPAFPPLDVTDRIPWIAVLATCSGLIASATASTRWLRWLQRFLLSGAVLAALLGPIGSDTSQTALGLAWMGGVGVALLASWVDLDALSARLPAPTVGLPLVVIAFVAAVACALSSIVVGQLSAALSASVGAVVVLGRKSEALHNVAPVYSTIFGALLLNGYVYSGLPATSSVALGTAPLLIWIANIGPLRRRPAWQRTVISTAAVLLPVVAAVALAVANSPFQEE